MMHHPNVISSGRKIRHALYGTTEIRRTPTLVILSGRVIRQASNWTTEIRCTPPPRHLERACDSASSVWENGIKKQGVERSSAGALCSKMGSGIGTGYFMLAMEMAVGWGSWCFIRVGPFCMRTGVHHLSRSLFRQASCIRKCS